MDENEKNEILSWSHEKVEHAKKKSRTLTQMKVMWTRIQNWAQISGRQDLSEWGAEEAMQILKYIEKLSRDKQEEAGLATKQQTLQKWNVMKSNLSIIQKVMIDKGFHRWAMDGKIYKLAKTTLSTIIRDESKTEISRLRITKKHERHLTESEIEKIAGKLYMNAQLETGAFRLLRYMQYVTWVFSNNTGMRLIDVLRLQWNQIVIRDGEIVQRVNYSKSDRSGRKCDEIIIHNRFQYPADTATALRACQQVRDGLQRSTNLMFPKTTNVNEIATPESMSKGWKRAAKDLAIDIDVGAKTPKVSFLNRNYQLGTPPKLLHSAASWGSNTDIRRHYIKSEAGQVAAENNQN